MHDSDQNLVDKLNAARSSLMELNEDDLCLPRVSRERSGDQTEVMVKNFTVKKDQSNETFSPAHAAKLLDYLNNLNNYSWVYYAADLLFENPKKEEKKRRQELMVECRKHDRYLFKWAYPLFEDDEKLKVVLIDIRKSRNSRDDAEDTIRCSKLYKDNWIFAEGKTPVTLEYIAQAEKDATELLYLMKKLEKKAKDPAKDLRIRAYTVWYKAYTALKHAGRYLCRDEDEAEKLFPGVSPVRTVISTESPPKKPEEPMEIIE